MHALGTHVVHGAGEVFEGLVVAREAGFLEQMDGLAAWFWRSAWALPIWWPAIPPPTAPAAMIWLRCAVEHPASWQAKRPAMAPPAMPSPVPWAAKLAERSLAACCSCSSVRSCTDMVCSRIASGLRLPCVASLVTAAEDMLPVLLPVLLDGLLPVEEDAAPSSQPARAIDKAARRTPALISFMS